jgi:hypothetical protein
MRTHLGPCFAAAIAFACSSSSETPAPPEISVGGTYQTAVTLESSTCVGQTVQTHPTIVTHVPGATAVSLSHAGSSYSGTLAADGSFITPPVTQVFSGISYQISISGQFSLTAIDALVTVAAGVQPPCSFTARWAGAKSGPPNVIP